MRGYLGRPADTAAVMLDGWLRTRDVEHLDADGYLTLVGRSKELIIQGCVNIYPNEIEAVLASDRRFSKRPSSAYRTKPVVKPCRLGAAPAGLDHRIRGHQVAVPSQPEQEQAARGDPCRRITTQERRWQARQEVHPRTTDSRRLKRDLNSRLGPRLA
jgi:acyl-CoA synthetase (AMP-forming)/AMP-acid ligase II